MSAAPPEPTPSQIPPFTLSKHAIVGLVVCPLLFALIIGGFCVVSRKRQLWCFRRDDAEAQRNFALLQRISSPPPPRPSRDAYDMAPVMSEYRRRGASDSSQVTVLEKTDGGGGGAGGSPRSAVAVALPAAEPIREPAAMHPHHHHHHRSMPRQAAQGVGS